MPSKVNANPRPARGHKLGLQDSSDKISVVSAPGLRDLARPMVQTSLALLLVLQPGCAPPSISAELAYFPSAPAVPRVVHLKSFNRLHELVAHRVTFRESVRGNAISPSVGTPAGLAYAKNTLYICDTTRNVVHGWNLISGIGHMIGADSENPLGEPVAVAIGERSGHVFVADTGRSRIAEFDSVGRFVRGIKPPERDVYRPVSVAVADRKLLVTDIAAHRIDVFDTDSGSWLTSFGGVGTGPGSFYFPMGVCALHNGRLAVSDMMNARVQLFDATFRQVLSMGGPGNHLGDFGKPRHIAVGPDGVLFIADAEFMHVHLFTQTGQLLMLVGGAGETPGATPLPVGVVVATDVPANIRQLVPDGFMADYFLFVSNSIGAKRLSLFAVGVGNAIVVEKGSIPLYRREH